MNPSLDISFIKREQAFWQNHLFENILPFWLKYGPDAKGGLRTCIDDHGKIISEDKWIWSQMRAVWVFSRIHNTFNRQGPWLELANHIYCYARDNAWIEDKQAWALCLDSNNRIIRGHDSIYVDGFALYGMSELYRANPDPSLLDTILRTAETVQRMLKLDHDRIPHFPYPIPEGARVHGIPMIFSHTFDSMAGIPDNRWKQEALRLGDEVLAHYYREKTGLLVERCTNKGTPLHPPDGTAVVSGHVIESVWFQIHLRENHSQQSRLPLLFSLLKRHLEIGWDEPFGGLLLAVDEQGGKHVAWGYPEAKLWWPHTEALYATFLAYTLTGDSDFQQWYERIKDYSLKHFATLPQSEWVQRLNRFGQPIQEVVSLPVKDPFHLPRSLILIIEKAQAVLERK